MGFAKSEMQLHSPAFKQGEIIPRQYTGEGNDLSPALTWSLPPQGSLSFAIICHDPDAPLVSRMGNYGFVHWVLYNIPAPVTGIAAGIKEYSSGINDFGSLGYGGPMPPEGHGIHSYYFWILAFNKELKLESGLTLWQLLKRTEPNLLGMNRLVGTYERK